MDDNCESCNKPVRRGYSVLMELEVDTCNFRLTKVPTKRSQGVFRFHGKCAEEQIIKQYKRRNK